MNLPKNVTNADLARLASPDEQTFVRLAIFRPVNSYDATIRGNLHTYNFSQFKEMSCQVLEVPSSVWMAGCGPTSYRGGTIAYDVMFALARLQIVSVPVVMPWAGAAAIAAPVAAAPPADVFTPLEDLLAKMDAPGEVIEALNLAKDGHAGALRQFVDGCFAEPDGSGNDMPPPSEPCPDLTSQAPNDRILKMNAARAAKRAEREAQLQPA